MTLPRVFQVDAFTDRVGCGNPAHVLLCEAPLAAERMQQLTRALGHGDAGFVFPAGNDGADIEVRFHTPRVAAPFIAHVTLAVHAVRAHLGLPTAPRQRLASGELIHVELLQAGLAPQFALELPTPAIVRAFDAQELAPLLAALGSPPPALDSAMPTLLAGGTSRRVLLALSGDAALAGLAPRMDALRQCSEQLGVGGIFCYVRYPVDVPADVEARMFAPALGLDEDPVSGNAFGMLAVALWRQGLLHQTNSGFVLRGAQGRSLGRPGQLRVELRARGRELGSLRAVGQAVVARELTCPQVGAAP